MPFIRTVLFLSFLLFLHFHLNLNGFAFYVRNALFSMCMNINYKQFWICLTFLHCKIFTSGIEAPKYTHEICWYCFIASPAESLSESRMNKNNNSNTNHLTKKTSVEHKRMNFYFMFASINNFEMMWSYVVCLFKDAIHPFFVVGLAKFAFYFITSGECISLPLTHLLTHSLTHSLALSIDLHFAHILKHSAIFSHSC